MGEKGIFTFYVMISIMIFTFADYFGVHHVMSFRMITILMTLALYLKPLLFLLFYFNDVITQIANHTLKSNQSDVLYSISSVIVPSPFPLFSPPKHSIQSVSLSSLFPLHFSDHLSLSLSLLDSL